MIRKRFIYRNGNLYLKTEESSTQNNNTNQEEKYPYKLNNLSRNENIFPNLSQKKILKGKKKNPTFQTQIEEKKIYRNNINEETQTMKSFQGNKFNNKINQSKKEKDKNSEEERYPSPIIKKKKIKKLSKINNLYSQIEKICNHVYLNSSGENNKNIFNEIYKKENDYVKKLNKNYLNINDDLLNKKNSVNNLARLKKYNSSDKSNSFNHYRISNERNNINNLNEPELIKKYFELDIHKTIDIDDDNILKCNQRSKYNFKNKGINSYKYIPPKIEKLKIEDKIKLPVIKPEKNKPIELVNFLIPNKKEDDNNKEKRNQYMLYKIMKFHRLNKFQI